MYYLGEQISQIHNEKSSDTVVIIHEGYHSYLYWFLKKVLNRRDITVVFDYNYEGEHHVVTVPKGTDIYMDEKFHGSVH